MTDPAPLFQHISRFSSARVLCVGDAMLDRFVTGTVTRISPEAPIPVLQVVDERVMVGGAGNVVANIISLGAAAALVTVLGDDATGQELDSMLGGMAGLTSHAVVEPGRVTTRKSRFIAGSQQLLRADRETIAPICANAERVVIAALHAEAPRAQVIILSDYGKGVLTQAVIGAAMAAGRAQSIPVLVDPKGIDFTRYRGAAVLSPNRGELHAASQMPVGSDAEVVAAARHVIARCGVGAVLVTRSEQGLSLVDATGEQHFPAAAREVFDVSGAGDTAGATFATALAAGAPRGDAAALANLAGGIVVGKVGTATIDPEDLLGALHDADLRATDAKVKTLEQAQSVIGGWQRRGQKVGFTNGTFDLIHPGHVASLAQARAACDRLVVGLNSDASVRRYKGPDRPIQNETARSIVLASLATVDLVVIFDEDTPIRLIEGVRPDVLVKGADYTIETVVGADFVQSYGGKVVLAKLVDGQSTTRTIQKIAG